MIDPKKLYRTRDGREVRIYAVDGVGAAPIHGAIFTPEGWEGCSWMQNGRWMRAKECSKDLIEVKPRIQREVWANVFPESVSWALFASKELADKYAHDDRIACVKLTIDCEEGEGL